MGRFAAASSVSGWLRWSGNCSEPRVAVAIGAFVWAVRHGQFDDLGAEGLGILLDDDRPAPDPDASDESEDESA